MVGSSSDFEVPLPVLMRRARAVYGRVMRLALMEADFGDVPVNGLYILGRLDLGGGGMPLRQLIGELGMSKQAAGQLVDVMVSRLYLSRDSDPRDRRKVIVALTTRGIAAAKVQRGAREALDATLVDTVGEIDFRRIKQILQVIVNLDQIGDQIISSNRDNSSPLGRSRQSSVGT